MLRTGIARGSRRLWQALAICVVGLLGMCLASCSGGGGGGSKKLRLVRIEVTPPNSSLALGTSAPFQATGIYANNTNADLTSLVTWSSSDAALASVTTGVPGSGLVSGVAMGTATITASLGRISGNTTVTITNAALGLVTK